MRLRRAPFVLATRLRWTAQPAAHQRPQHPTRHHPLHAAFLLPRLCHLGPLATQRRRPTHPTRQHNTIINGRAAATQRYTHRLHRHTATHRPAHAPPAKRDAFPHPPGAANDASLRPADGLARHRHRLPPSHRYRHQYARPSPAIHQYGCSLITRHHALASRVASG